MEKKNWNLALPGMESIAMADKRLKEVSVNIQRIVAVDAVDPTVGYDLAESNDNFCAAVAGWIFVQIGFDYTEYIEFSKVYFKTEKMAICRVLIYDKNGAIYDALCEKTFAGVISAKVLQMIVERHNGKK